MAPTHPLQATMIMCDKDLTNNRLCPISRQDFQVNGLLNSIQGRLLHRLGVTTQLSVTVQ